MGVPTDRRYSQSHEWFQVDGDTVTMGITQFAADELTDITFVDLPDVGSTLASGEPFGEVDSVKATSDLFSAFTGEVVATNPRVTDEPELLNNDPFNDGWLVRLRTADLAPLEKLLDAAAYEKMIAE